MSLKICCICLREANNLQALNSEDNAIQLKGKLEYVAPEFEWLKIFSICIECNVQLDRAYSFKQLCCTNELFRRKFVEQEKDDNAIAAESVPDCKNEEYTIKDENYTCNNICHLKTFICYHCNEEFNSKLILKKHINLMHPNICKICNKQLNSKKQLQIHTCREHKEKSTPKFQCDLCKETFSLLKNILNHCVTVHSMNQKEIKPYRCELCNNKFASSTLLIQHKKYHVGDRTFTCTICGKSFITRRDLTGHEKLHENQRNYGCEKCGKSFNTSQNLKTHIYVVHTDSSQWKYSCPICSKKFAMKTNCNEHVKRHQGDKDFECYICKKTFVSNHEVKKHIKIHSNIAPFICTLCQKYYRDRRSLVMHLSTTHGIGTAKPKRAKKISCHICPRQFGNNLKLQRHIRTHVDVKPFKSG